MTSVFSLFADELDATLIKELKQRFGNVRLDVVVSDGAGDARMTDEVFWGLINLLEWDADTNAAIVAPLVSALQKNDVAEIYRFEALLSRFLYQLDTSAHAQAFGPDYLSTDGFLYSRAAVVANGEDTYKQVLEHPASMPTDVTFEPLLYVARTAFRAKTGTEMQYFPLYNYETYSNTAGWSDRKP